METRRIEMWEFDVEIRKVKVGSAEVGFRWL